MLHFLLSTKSIDIICRSVKYGRRRPDGAGIPRPDVRALTSVHHEDIDSSCNSIIFPQLNEREIDQKLALNIVNS